MRARINFREGRVTNAIKKVGSALWRRKGDLATMAGGALASRALSKAANRQLDSKGWGRVASVAYGAARKSKNKGFKPFAQAVGAAVKGAGKVAKYGARPKGMLAGALTALAAKKAIGATGRTAMRAGRWAKRKVFGESDVVFVTGIRLAESR